MNLNLNSAEIKIITLSKKESKSYEFKNIIHISDIHIPKLRQKFARFHDGFKELVGSIKHLRNRKLKKYNTIIVITGDIFNDGCNPKSNSMKFFIDLLEKLSAIFHTVIIPGNHDNDKKGQVSHEGTDLLTVLIEDFYSKGNSQRYIHYLQHTGIYQIENLLFYHASVFDLETYDRQEEDRGKRLNLLPNRLENSNKKHIGIGHYSLDNTVCQNGYLLRDQTFKVKDIEDKNYDVCLLGDNHHTNLILGNKKNIGYPGSLIQLNYGEEYKNHGYLLWDLESYSSTFHELECAYGYYTLNTIKNDFDFEKELKNIVPYANVKIVHNDQEIFNEIEEKLKKERPNLTEISSRLAVGDISEEKQDIKYDVIDQYNNFINTRDEYKEQSEKLLEIHQSKMNIIKDKLPNYQNKLEKIEFQKLTLQNFLRIKDKTCLDLSNIQDHSIIGIFGYNGHGKTTLIKGIQYAIWGGERDTKQHIRYNEKKKLLVEFEFKYGRTLYKLTRTIRPNKNGKTTLDFEKKKWKFMDKGL